MSNGVKAAIREEDGVHNQWHADAKAMTLDRLPEFIRHLTEDYQHDYGTICHAVAAAGIAAMNAVNKSDQGGITGFQAGCIQFEVLRQWGLVEFPARILEYKNLLYPQYEYLFRSIPSEIWAEVMKMAQDQLNNREEFMSERVREHIASIAAGNAPFGLTISN